MRVGGGGVGQVVICYLDADGDRVGQPTGEGGQAPGKQQGSEAGRPVAVGVAGAEIYVMNLGFPPPRSY